MPLPTIPTQLLSSEIIGEYNISSGRKGSDTLYQWVGMKMKRTKKKICYRAAGFSRTDIFVSIFRLILIWLKNTDLLYLFYYLHLGCYAHSIFAVVHSSIFQVSVVSKLLRILNQTIYSIHKSRLFSFCLPCLSVCVCEGGG